MALSMSPGTTSEDFDVNDYFNLNSEEIFGPTQKVSIDDVDEILSKLMHPTSGVEVKDRKYHLKTYKECFVGEMAVEWLCKYFACTKETAVEIGQEMYRRNYIVHVVDESKGFLNDYLFYMFTPEAVAHFKASDEYRDFRKKREAKLAMPLDEVLIAMMDSRRGVDLRDRKYYMKWYKRCFVGQEAVKWLMRYFMLERNETETAVSKGQELLTAGYIIHTVDEEKPFLDGYFFYIFTPQARQTEAKYLRKLTTSITAGTPRELAWQMNDPITGIFTRDHKRRMKTIKSCFTGEDLVDWVLKHMRVRSRGDACKIAERLMGEGYLELVHPRKKTGGEFVDGSKDLYRLRVQGKADGSVTRVASGVSLEDSERRKDAGSGGYQEDQYVTVEDFSFKQVLGVGGFGTVYLSQKKDNERFYAIKAIRKARFRTQKDIDSLLLESEVLRNDHPYLLHLYWAFTNSEFIYLVLDYIGGGDLFHHLQQHKSGFARKTVQFFIAQVLLGLEHLHACGIIYRDMKLENILVDVDGNLCLADFGLSKILDNADDRATTMCGTPGYVAPEVLLGKGYKTNVDLWSMGVLMYELSTGRNPFLGADRHQTLLNIMKVNPYFPEEYFSKRAKSLLEMLLTRDPKERPQRAESLKSHPYFKDIDWTKLLLKQVPSPFKIVVTGEDDVSHFDEEFTQLKIRLEDNSPVHDIDPVSSDRSSGAGINVRWSQFKLVEPDAGFSRTSPPPQREGIVMGAR
eukprot:CAMPEP_0119127646 /NCGR_PEP_ID=MMETSP1310-20130426/6115_1 /TAXON_ID=464262 /ORGANISM="Genus nov. species nov., Strain RCC2339" /LENGTH=740 /DNA_ID=CAMNT_0007117923 /DNA_START=94 /DNA_END=2313 /DNA_ORIENTATION=-